MTKVRNPSDSRGVFVAGYGVVQPTQEVDIKSSDALREALESGRLVKPTRGKPINVEESEDDAS